jgi:hypothetical protein
MISLTPTHLRLRELVRAAAAYNADGMKLRWWKTADEMAAGFVAGRIPQMDAEFLSECALPADDDAVKAALAVRRSVAKYGMVDAAFIRADDGYPGELMKLAGWDSIDFLTWAMELHEELGPRTRIGWFDDLPDPFSVRDLAERAYRGLSTPPPRAEFTVIDTFTIRGRGTVAEGIKLEQRHLFKKGDRVSIRRLDGTVSETIIEGVEPLVGAKYVTPPAPKDRRWSILLVGDVDLPHGSVITNLSRDA